MTERRSASRTRVSRDKVTIQRVSTTRNLEESGSDHLDHRSETTTGSSRYDGKYERRHSISPSFIRSQYRYVKVRDERATTWPIGDTIAAAAAGGGGGGRGRGRDRGVAGDESSEEDAGSEPGSTTSTTKTITRQVPQIWRTVIRERGNHPSSERSYHSLTKEDYESVNTAYNMHVAFEMRKHVRTIPPSRTSKSLDVERPRNAVLDNEIVDYVVSEQMVIRSSQLLKAIKKVVFWPSTAFYDGQKRLILNSPFRSIGVYREEFNQHLTNYKRELQNLTISARDPENPPDNDTVKHIRDLGLTVADLELFLEEVDKVQNRALISESMRHDHGHVTFDMLWRFFKPGEVVYTSANGCDLACIVELLIWNQGAKEDLYGPDQDAPYKSVDVQMWYLDHDGIYINRRIFEVTIDRFHGEKAIDELPVYPESFARNKEDKRDNLTQRGMKYLDLLKGHFRLCQYEGTLSIADTNPYMTQDHRAFSGRVIVDPEQHCVEYGVNRDAVWHDDYDIRSNSPRLQIQKFIKFDPTKQYRVEEHSGEEQSPVFGSKFSHSHYILLPEWLHGFVVDSLGDRRWVWLKVDDLKPYKPDLDLIETVALDKESLDLIKSMTYVHESGTNEVRRSSVTVEHIEHKGEGRAIILYGAPGVGKTYTVECVAEWSGRPLLRLTCAELGLNPTELERNLGEYFRRAERWNAIVFLDEADVFMSKRYQESSAQDDATVAVFLRTLEYYSGIIFLITNRIDDIDKAIVNRALLIMKYQQLTNTQRTKIMDNCLKKFKKTGYLEIGLDAEMCLIKSICGEQPPHGYEWDGREIVQVLNLTGILASYDYHTTSPNVRASKAKVEIHHVERAMKIIRNHAVPRLESANKKNLGTKMQGYRDDRLDH